MGSFFSMFVHRLRVRRKTKFVTSTSFRLNWSICVKWDPAPGLCAPVARWRACLIDKFPFGIKMLEF